MARPTKKSIVAKKISQALSKLTDEAKERLKQVYALDASVAEICSYLNIDQKTLWNWRQKNPELFLELDRLRNQPTLRARRTFVANLDQLDAAIKYLKAKRKNEFSERTEVENTDVQEVRFDKGKKMTLEELQNHFKTVFAQKNGKNKAR